jgi:Domain of unknown function (DUF397)
VRRCVWGWRVVRYTVMESQGHANVEGVGRDVRAGSGLSPAGGSAAEVSWWKSSYSTYNGNCVEVAALQSGEVGVRDSKDKLTGAILTFSAADWSVFLGAVKSGDLSTR